MLITPAFHSRTRKGSSKSDSPSWITDVFSSSSISSESSDFGSPLAFKGSALNNSLAVVSSNSSANESLIWFHWVSLNLDRLSKISSFKHEIPILEMVSFC
ncbi:hypothetical protein OGAPHI_003504 [Ogataea philodendri]|uniref:Uncharacterized protein n=1 Tax=Ogataea philodendri TaxID=1378263 RepID=A0A9P8P6M1_9ASCO|nr:uncharacterized protein OGAPHI_003504 [Ogataea philodendri]KAH3666508.1 hypothetical protein OGAPHI_003504 [Ogataea philodendri]